MKTRVFVQRFLCVTNTTPIQIVVLDERFYAESQIAMLAQACENFIFMEELIDLGLIYDTETKKFERADGRPTEGSLGIDVML